MHRLILIAAGVVSAAVLFSVRTAAQVVTVSETASAMVKPQPVYISSNYNGSTSATLTPVNPDGYAVAGIIFWRFNLNSYAGWSTTNDGDLTVGQNWGEPGPHTFRVYAVQSNWTETTVTWENYFGTNTTAAGDKSYTNWFGPELAATGVVFVDQNTLTHWSIPAAAIQTWLQGASPYYGLAIVPDDAGNNMFYTRLATWKPAQFPRLTLNVYPTPLPQVATNFFRVRNHVRMPNVPGLGLNLAGYAKLSSLIMHELMPLGNFEPLLHGSLHFASSSQSTPAKWTAAAGPSLSAAAVVGYQLEVLTGAAAGRSARITNLIGNAFYLDTPLLSPAENDAFAVRGVTSNFYQDYYVASNVLPTGDVAPGSHGIMAALFQPASELTYLMDNHTTPSYIVFTGTYVMSFWARSTTAGQSLQIIAARWNWGGTYLFNSTVPITTNWVRYAFTNTITADPNGTNFRVTMKRAGGTGGIYVDDWSLQKLLPTTQTVYTREAQDAITNVMTWCGRHWLGDLGDSLDNLLAPRDGQMPTEDSLWGSGYYPTMPEFLDACEKMNLGAAWFTLPVVFSTNEGMNLIEFLVGPTNTPYGAVRAQRGHPAPWTASLTIFLELGNEVWNYQNGPPYARMITQLFGAMRQSPWFDNAGIALVMGGQAGNDWRADNSVPQAKYYDAFDNAGYTMGSYSSTNTDDTFGPLMAFHDYQYANSFGYQRDLLVSDGRGKRFTIYEMNMHTTSGTAPEGVRNAMVTSAGAAVAGFDALLTHYYQSQMPCINVFAMMGNGFNYGGGVVKLWGIYASLEMGQPKRPYYHSMLGANRAIGRRAHLLETDTVGTPATWMQTLKNGVQGTFPYLKCYAVAESNVYRVVLVNRDWWSNRVAQVTLPFTFNGTVPYTRFRPDNGSAWATVESGSFVGWGNGTVSMTSSNLAADLPACSFTIFTISNATAAMHTLVATRDGRGTFGRDPSGSYAAGTTLSASAFPDDDAQFLGWTGDVTGMTQTVSLTLDRDYRITALFTPVPEPCDLALLLLAVGRPMWRRVSPRKVTSAVPA